MSKLHKLTSIQENPPFMWRKFPPKNVIFLVFNMTVCHCANEAVIWVLEAKVRGRGEGEGCRHQSIRRLVITILFPRNGAARAAPCASYFELYQLVCHVDWLVFCELWRFSSVSCSFSRFYREVVIVSKQEKEKKKTRMSNMLLIFIPNWRRFMFEMHNFIFDIIFSVVCFYSQTEPVLRK